MKAKNRFIRSDHQQGETQFGRDIKRGLRKVLNRHQRRTWRIVRVRREKHKQIGRIKRDCCREGEIAVYIPNAIVYVREA